MTLQERGIVLTASQHYYLNNYPSIPLVERRASKTFLSWVMVMESVLSKPIGYPVFLDHTVDPDNTSSNRIIYWRDGLIDFAKKYYPEISIGGSRIVGLVAVVHKQTKKSKLLNSIKDFL